MIPDGLDRFIRANFPQPEITPARLERIESGVMARLPARRRPALWQAGMDWLAELAPTPAPALLLRQAALPVCLAALLGLYVGVSLPQPRHGAAALSSLATPTSVLLAGY